MHACLLKVHMILCFLHGKSRRPFVIAVAKAIDVKLGQLLDEDVSKMCPLFFPGLTYGSLKFGNSSFMLRY